MLLILTENTITFNHFMNRLNWRDRPVSPEGDGRAKCQKDFNPSHGGIFDGPITAQAAKLLGISFDRIDLETNKVTVASQRPKTGSFFFSAKHNRRAIEKLIKRAIVNRDRRAIVMHNKLAEVYHGCSK